MNKKISILNVPFLHTTKNKFVDILQQHLLNGNKTFIVTANPEIVMEAYDDPTFTTTLHQADYIIADGIGVVIASKLMKEPLPERVAGIDVMMDLLALANHNQNRIFLLGAKEEVLLKVKEKIKQQFPKIHIVGTHNGYFTDDASVAEMVQQAKPDLTFVALGFPRQEKWIASYLDMFDHGIFMGVGGSFDVLAGTAKRAPVFWQKANLEWLYRLVKQPSRWKRMLQLPRFIMKVILHKNNQ